MRNEWYILNAMAEKILTASALMTALNARRARKERIVFTNGCFDLLHVGHTRYLQEARKLGDCLVVGLNSDASVRAIKSDGRPVVPQAQRAEVLAALACVDHVVIFDEPDPQNLIARVQPDILVKGGDWPIDQIVGREIVQARGGRVVTIPLVPDVSTTSLIRRIKTLS
ncbi:MAG TPA: D-glycero-beta-D-manno-heptose 1-phosphate adenylyltransferase [Nitrospirales bacterium]|nr:D-glycero-beta-D-manno-heptose 1-phosphate adenylyltransferase [Nitrospirales bacterium]